jgi:hypothetical protein
MESRVRCPAKCFHGLACYDGRLRPVACKTCRGTGYVPPLPRTEGSDWTRKPEPPSC